MVLIVKTIIYITDRNKKQGLDHKTASRKSNLLIFSNYHFCTKTVAKRGNSIIQLAIVAVHKFSNFNK